MLAYPHTNTFKNLILDTGIMITVNISSMIDDGLDKKVTHSDGSLINFWQTREQDVGLPTKAHINNY